MNSVHDLGGMHGFGSVEHDPDAPSFHHDWERRVFASFVATLGQGLYSMDEVRHAIERMPPGDYLNVTYYEKWLAGMERLLIETGVLDRETIEERALAFERGEATVHDRTDPALHSSIREGMAAAYAATADHQEPLFAPGDEVMLRNVHPRGHTRVPRYARGKQGVVATVRGTFSFPDAGACGEDEAFPVYSVAFDQETLWGPDGEGDELRMDLWEPYLDRVACP